MKGDDKSEIPPPGMSEAAATEMAGEPPAKKVAKLKCKIVQGVARISIDAKILFVVPHQLCQNVSQRLQFSGKWMLYDWEAVGGILEAGVVDVLPTSLAYFLSEERIVNMPEKRETYSCTETKGYIGEEDAFRVC